jgi:hypothetical protein
MACFFTFTSQIAAPNPDFIYPFGFGDDEHIVNSNSINSEIAIFT